MKLIKSLLILLLYSLFIIFLIEVTTRLYFKITDKDIEVYKNYSFERIPKIYTIDQVLGYKLIPNVSRNAFTSDFRVIYKINSIGLREKEIEATDRFKIIFLGDSQTFGEGIPYGSRFSDLIESEIKNTYTINAGVPGYGIHQMYLWLRQYGMNLKPDLIICAITQNNLARSIYKVVENSPHLLTPKQEVKHPENKICYPGHYFKNISDWLLSKSYFYSVIKVRVKIMQMLFHLKKRDKQVWDKIRENGRTNRNKIAIKMIEEESTKILLDLKDTCENAQVELLVVNVSTRPIDWLSNFFTEHNIEYFDLSDQLSKLSKIKFEIDPHYNVKGNIAIAHLLGEYILNRYKNKIIKIIN